MSNKYKQINKRKIRRVRKLRRFIIRMMIICTVVGAIVYIPIKIKEKKIILAKAAQQEKINEENKLLENFNRLKEDRKSIYASDEVLMEIDNKIEEVTKELENGVTDRASILVEELNSLIVDISYRNHNELESLFNKLNEDEMLGFTEEELNKVNTLLSEYNSLMKQQRYSEAKVALDDTDSYIEEVKKEVEKRTTKEIYNKKSSEESSSRTPTYINGVLLVNKKNGLPDSFGNGEDPEARAAFEEMKSEAAKEGIFINAFSTYRSYWSQDRLYSDYVDTYGQEPTDTFSARAGFSEHQTGLAFDIGGTDRSLWAEDDFKYTAEAEWLKNNAYKYGFILRYPEGKEWKTGFMYESWHFRYIGKEHSKNFKDNNLTLEEYLGQ